MTTDVEERSEAAVLAPHHEDALVAHLHGPVAARGADLVRAPDADPEPAEQAFLLELPDRGVVVEPPGQRARQAAAGVRGGGHAESAAGKTMTFRRASPPSIAAIASLICSSG